MNTLYKVVFVNIFMVFLLLICNSVHSQVFFSNTNRNIGQFQPANCEVYYLPLFSREGPDIIRYPDFFRDLAISPDGRLYGFSVSDEKNKSFLIEVDILDRAARDTILTLNSTQDYRITALTIDSLGIFYFGHRLLQSFNSESGVLRSIGRLPNGRVLQGDLVLWNDEMYASTGGGGSSTRIFKVNLFIPEESELVFQGMTDTICALGMSPWYNEIDQELQFLLSSACRSEEQYIKIFDPTSGTLKDLCSNLYSERDIILGLTSEDEFRTNFSLRLDLDKDNSRGRLIDHFIIDSLCTVRFPIADNDAWVQSTVGPIDSVRFTVAEGVVHAGEEVFFAEANPSFSIRGQGTDQLVAVNTGGATDAEVAEFIRQGAL